jgi:hypothetical protein
MCECTTRPLTFESMLSDPLIRMVMASDGIALETFVEIMETAREAVLARQLVAMNARMAQAPASGAWG